MNKYFITGIGTGIGKTIVSAIISEALKADYFKPLQCGNLEYTDSDFIRDHLFNSKSIVHNEAFCLRKAASPHDAAKAESKLIQLKDVVLPNHSNSIIIEGAGGILVPLNDNNEYVIDLANLYEAKIILVIGYYLGCINHTLLTLSYLKTKGINPVLLVFNGDKVEQTKKAILNYINNIPYVEIQNIEISPDNIKTEAERIYPLIKEILV